MPEQYDKKLRELLTLGDRELKLCAGETTHQHYKGGLYRIIGGVMDSSTGKAMVDDQGNTMFLYEHLYPYERQYWLRSSAEWFEGVEAPDWHPAKEGTELLRLSDGTPARILRFRPLGQSWMK